MKILKKYFNKRNVVLNFRKTINNDIKKNINTNKEF